MATRGDYVDSKNDLWQATKDTRKEGALDLEKEHLILLFLFTDD